ncbi:hypothetical protein CCYA_CCYA13G3506 [Cyanidiococcus yangmingshanensis]|nr:hypothetical protein CCYA_CCYA13G3506 [Cyanidiococcus yangmingshanensis]
MFRSPGDSFRRVLRSPAKAVARMSRKASKHTVYFRIHRLVPDEELRSSALDQLVERPAAGERKQRPSGCDLTGAKRVLVQLGRDRSRPALQSPISTDGVWEETLAIEVTLYENVSEKSYDPKIAQVKLFDEQRGRVLGLAEVDIAQFAKPPAGDATSRHRRTPSQNAGECLLELRSPATDAKTPNKHGRVEGVLLISIGIDHVCGVSETPTLAGSRDSASQWSSTESSASVSDFATAQHRDANENGREDSIVAAAGSQTATLGEGAGSLGVSASRGSVRSFHQSPIKQEQYGTRDLQVPVRTSQSETFNAGDPSRSTERQVSNSKPISLAPALQGGGRGLVHEPPERTPLLNEASLWKRERDRFAKQLLLQAETFQEEIRELSATNSALRVQLAALCRERQAQQIFSHQTEKPMASPVPSGTRAATPSPMKAGSMAKVPEAPGDQDLEPVPVGWDRERLAREWQIARAGQRAAVTQAHVEVEAALRDAAARAMASLRHFTSWHDPGEETLSRNDLDRTNSSIRVGSQSAALAQTTPSECDEPASRIKAEQIQDLEQQLIAAKMAHAQSEGRMEELRQALRDAQRRLLVEQQRAMELARELSQFHDREGLVVSTEDTNQGRASVDQWGNLTNRSGSMSEARFWRRFTPLDALRSTISDPRVQQNTQEAADKEGLVTRRRAHSVTNATAEKTSTLASNQGRVSTDQSRPWRLGWRRHHRRSNHPSETP